MNELLKLGPEGAPAIAESLRKADNETDTEEKIETRLKQIATPEAARALTQALDHTNGLVRLRAAEGLLKQDSKNKEALAVLGECMKDANADVRIAAVYTINNLSTNLGSATAALVPGLLNALNSEKTWMRAGAILAVTKLGSQENQIISALTEKSHDEDIFVRLHAAEALAKLDGQTNVAVGVLTELLSNSDHSARGQAAIALADLAPAYRPALSALEELLRDPNPSARYGAAKAFWALNHDAGEVVPTLIGIVEDNIHMRWAIDLLGEIGPPAKAAVPVLKKAGWSKRSGAYARAALAKIDPNASSTISTPPAGVGTRPVKRVEKPISIPAVPVALAPQIKTLNTP